MDAKTLFLKKKDLSHWWVTVARDDRFADVTTHARSVLMESQPNQEQIRGAETVLKILETLADGPESNVPFPSPGLIHTKDRNTEKKQN